MVVYSNFGLLGGRSHQVFTVYPVCHVHYQWIALFFPNQVLWLDFTQRVFWTALRKRLSFTTRSFFACSEDDRWPIGQPNSYCRYSQSLKHILYFGIFFIWPRRLGSGASCLLKSSGQDVLNVFPNKWHQIVDPSCYRTAEIQGQHTILFKDHRTLV